MLDVSEYTKFRQRARWRESSGKTPELRQDQSQGVLAMWLQFWLEGMSKE